MKLNEIEWTVWTDATSAKCFADFVLSEISSNSDQVHSTIYTALTVFWRETNNKRNKYKYNGAIKIRIKFERCIECYPHPHTRRVNGGSQRLTTSVHAHACAVRDSRSPVQTPGEWNEWRVVYYNYKHFGGCRSLCVHLNANQKYICN